MNADSSLLSNGLPLPPIPQRLQEMLKDYPKHLQELQEELNYVLDDPKRARGSTNMAFEEVIWGLERCLDAFIREAKDELETRQTSGDADAIARADAKLRLMFRARSGSAGMLNLSELREYIDQHLE
jgi:hypothetical protein